MSLGKSEITFLQRTIYSLAKYGKTPADVLWVGIRPYFHFQGEEPFQKGTWEDFARLADSLYPKGFTINDVDANAESDDIELGLMLVGTDWWMERGHNDEFGLCWWAFKTLPRVPEVTVPLEALWYERDE